MISNKLQPFPKNQLVSQVIWAFSRSFSGKFPCNIWKFHICMLAPYMVIKVSLSLESTRAKIAFYSLIFFIMKFQVTYKIASFALNDNETFGTLKNMNISILLLSENFHIFNFYFERWTRWNFVFQNILWPDFVIWWFCLTPLRFYFGPSFECKYLETL